MTRVVHFGVDQTGVLATLRRENYQLDDTGTSIEKLEAAVQDHKPDALVVSQYGDGPLVEILSPITRAAPSMARILFQDQSKQLVPRFFDLVIPFQCSPLNWISRVNNLIERSSALRLEWAELSSKSLRLRSESATALSESARVRSRSVLERHRSKQQRESFLRGWTGEHPSAVFHREGWARALVVDDHPAFRQKLVQFLHGHPSTLIVGEAKDGVEAVRKAAELLPDLILLDIGLPGLNGFEVARKIRNTIPGVKVVFISANSGAEFVMAAFDVGAAGYVHKNHVAKNLKRAIDAVLRGNAYISNRVAANHS